MKLLIILVEMRYSYEHYINCPESNSDRHLFLRKKGCRELNELNQIPSYEALVEFKPLLNI